MKVEFSCSGIIKIIAESDTEAYALQKWCEDEINNGNINSNNLILDVSYDSRTPVPEATE